MTARERVLAMAVGALVPISIAFMLVFWFIGKYSDNNNQFVGLQSQISAEKDKTALAIKANQRRIFYRSTSLPADLVDASNEYQTWLKKLVRDQIKMDFKSVTPRDGGDLKYKNKLIGRTKTFTLLATADLKQLSKFLYEFYTMDVLHRINSIKIIPLTSGTGNEKRVRSGKLSLIITVEAVSMVDADAEREFTQCFCELPLTEEEYEEALVRRNIFGPANNTPTVAARPSSSPYAGTDIKVNVTGNDADKNDLLYFELLESSVEGAKLTQADEQSRRATLEIPGQPAGKYKFKVAVSDNGFPSKSNEKEFTVTFKDRPVKKTAKPEPPKEKYRYAQFTSVKGIVKGVDGVWRVWIKVMPTGERYQLKAGDSFQLDDKQWTVKLVEHGRTVIQVEDQLLTFFNADSLDSPKKIETLETQAGESETKTETTTSLEEVDQDLKTDSSLENGGPTEDNDNVEKVS